MNPLMATLFVELKAYFVDTYKENGGKIEVVRTTDIHKPHLVGSAAGYLIKDCI
nr:hypothetical protein [Pasteurella multocida]